MRGALKLRSLLRRGLHDDPDGASASRCWAAILGSGIVFLDGTVVNVALPAIREDLDTGLAAQQWIVEAYLLTLGALLLVGGSLGDLLGRRRVFIAGLAGLRRHVGAVRGGAERRAADRGARRSRASPARCSCRRAWR